MYSKQSENRGLSGSRERHTTKTGSGSGEGSSQLLRVARLVSSSLLVASSSSPSSLLAIVLLLVEESELCSWFDSRNDRSASRSSPSCLLETTPAVLLPVTSSSLFGPRLP